MNQIRRIIYITIGILLLLNGIIVAFVANYNLGILLTILLGMLSLCYGVYFTKIKAFYQKYKWIQYLLYTGVAFFLGIILFLGVYGQSDNVTHQENAIIILGAGGTSDAASYGTAGGRHRVLEKEQKLRYHRNGWSRPPGGHYRGSCHGAVSCG